VKTCGDGFLSRWRNGDYHGASALSENGHGGCGSGRCGPDRAGPTFGSTDLLAELFDNELYDHVTFADLIGAHRRPYVLLNAADISLGTRFEFTQEQFDFLYSDLGKRSRQYSRLRFAPGVTSCYNMQDGTHVQ
jgi:hypothetical protein